MFQNSALFFSLSLSLVLSPPSLLTLLPLLSSLWLPNHPPCTPSFDCSMKKEKERPHHRGDTGGPAPAHHWMLPLLALASVPLVSEDRALLRELRLASQGSASRRGGMRSLIRSRPFASSKLVILCWGEKPLMAGVGRRRDVNTDRFTWGHGKPPHTNINTHKHTPSSSYL